MHPNASAVTAHATRAEDPAAARLSFRQALIWLPPANSETMPRTAAKMAKFKKKKVAPFPPKPAKLILNQVNPYNFSSINKVQQNHMVNSLY